MTLNLLPLTVQSRIKLDQISSEEKINAEICKNFNLIALANN